MQIIRKINENINICKTCHKSQSINFLTSLGRFHHPGHPVDGVFEGVERLLAPRNVHRTPNNGVEREEAEKVLARLQERKGRRVLGHNVREFQTQLQLAATHYAQTEQADVCQQKGHLYRKNFKNFCSAFLFLLYDFCHLSFTFYFLSLLLSFFVLSFFLTFCLSFFLSFILSLFFFFIFHSFFHSFFLLSSFILSFVLSFFLSFCLSFLLSFIISFFFFFSLSFILSFCLSIFPSFFPSFVFF